VLNDSPIGRGSVGGDRGKKIGLRIRCRSVGGDKGGVVVLGNYANGDDRERRLTIGGDKTDVCLGA